METLDLAILDHYVPEQVRLDEGTLLKKLGEFTSSGPS
jgi:hypothetical protein